VKNGSQKVVLRDRIITAATPGMTTANTFDRKPPTLNDAMFFYRFDGILRACGSIPTPRRKKRRQAVSVKIYRKKNNKLKNLFHKPEVYKLPEVV
jgi:hypothetical protein